MSSVYLMQSGDSSIYKIGKSVNTASRKKSLVSGNPEGLSIIKTWTIMNGKHSEFEKLLHSYFSQYKIRGTESKEFFDFSAIDILDVIDTIDKLYNEYDNTFVEIEFEAAKYSRIDKITGEFLQTNPGDSVFSIYNQISQNRDKMKLLEYETELLELQLKAKIGENQGIINGKNGSILISWKPRESTRFDSASFKEEYPELYKRYTKQTVSRFFIVQ